MKSQTDNHNFTLIAFSFIFFGWGLLTSLNGVLVDHLNKIFELNTFQSNLISFTFFATYFFISLIFFFVSQKKDVLKNLGYKYLTISGLTIAAIGAYLIYPASEFLSFPIFMCALVVLASGITILQIAANTYIVNLGTDDFGSSRLNFAQAINSLGATLGPFVGSLLILKTLDLSASDISMLHADQLLSLRKIQGISVQLPYWLIATSLFILAAIVFFMPMPDLAPDKDDKVKENATISHNNLWLAALGIFVYVGAEVTIGSNLGNIIDKQYPQLIQDKTFLITTYWGLAMAGRFFGGFILRYINAGKLIFLFASGALLLLITGIAGSGETSLYMLVGIGLFNSIMFPGIFSSGVHKLEGYSGKGASLLIMAIAGGAIIPAFYNLISPVTGIKYALVVAGLCYAYIAFYGRYFQKFSISLK